MSKFEVKSSASESKVNSRLELCKALRSSPIPDEELGGGLGLYIERMHLSRILLMHDIYRKIINTHGVIIEFGVRWGQNVSLFNHFRGMYEPYNYNRKIIGFDTFSGFPQVDVKDGLSNKIGDYDVSVDYKDQLEHILEFHEKQSPLQHIKKWELVEGDASETFPDYLERQPETIIALAYFDFDIYLPTKNCLELVMNNVTKGSVIVFDELNCEQFPGETAAFKEVIGSYNVRLQRDANNPLVSWFEVE